MRGSRRSAKQSLWKVNVGSVDEAVGTSLPDPVTLAVTNPFPFARLVATWRNQTASPVNFWDLTLNANATRTIKATNTIADIAGRNHRAVGSSLTATASGFRLAVD